MEHPQEKDLEETNSSPTIEDENQDSFLDTSNTEDSNTEPYRVLARNIDHKTFQIYWVKKQWSKF